MESTASPDSWKRRKNRSDHYMPMENYKDVNKFDESVSDKNQLFHEEEPKFSTQLFPDSDTKFPSQLYRDEDTSFSQNQIASQPVMDDQYKVVDFAEVPELNDQTDFQEFYPGIDAVQLTVNSMGGASVDTQDSGMYKDAPLTCGNIQFWTDIVDHANFSAKKHYVCVPVDTPTDELADFMATYWRMRSPKIVLSVVSGVRHFKGWKNVKIKEQFQRGIIKAANTTELWIITNGLDSGIAKTIGDAVREERARRVSNRIQHMYLHGNEAPERLPKVTLMGIMPRECVEYASSFDGVYEGPIIIKNEGHKPSSLRYELNPDHTHFILVEEESKTIFTNFRCLFEKRLGYQLGHPRWLRRFFSFESCDTEEEKRDISNQSIPVVGLLIQGGFQSIDHILYFLKNKMPVLVLKGIGGVADLIAYCYEELQERSDLDFEENALKPELIKRLTKAFPDDFKENDIARNTFRDKILECVKCAQEEEQSFLTFVNMKGWDANLKDLDKYILRALFRSEKSFVWREQIYKDLQLTLDWNRPDLALSEIFEREDWTKIKVEKNIFEQALIKKDREEFVALFLENNFQVHKYLNHKKLKFLFEKAEDREFFVTNCMVAILGKTGEQPLVSNFLDTDLNRLIYKLSGIRDFVQPYELSMNSVGLYVLDPAVAERKALNCLIFWAVLMNRHKMAKLLWGRSDDPIPVALICSNIYKQLANFSMELYLRHEMEQNAKEFGKMALGILDISFRDASAQAYSMLSKPLPDFNNKTPMEIAHDTGYLHFIAHPCCQKWLTKKMFGAIVVKELDWGVFRLPYWFKIIASVFLIFPMYIWIKFSPGPTRSKVEIFTIDDVDDDSVSDSTDDGNLPHSKSMLEKEFRRNGKKPSGIRLRTVLKKRREFKPPFWKQINLLWNAPITKFWMTQVFYFIYLGIFSLALLWPTCGNFYLDLIVWLWTAVILTEIARRTYIKHQKYKALSLFGHCVEIIFILLFLITFLILRIIPHWTRFSSFITSKIVMSIALIFFFYRLLGVYLPISPTLGPNLVRMVRMVKYDFVAFIRMFLIFLFAGGVTTQAVLYPNYPLGMEMVKKVLVRPIISLFLTPISDLDGTEDCNKLYSNISDGYCARAYSLEGSPPFKAEPKMVPVTYCPYSSLGGHVVVLQYLIICKLILTTILFAMFALTISKVDNEASEIWKFQRYALIVDFEERLCFPPPLTVVSYFVMLVMLIYKKCCLSLSSCWQKTPLIQNFCWPPESSQSSRKTKKFISEHQSKMQNVMRMKQTENYNYWKKCAKEYTLTLETQKKIHDIPKKQAEIVINLQEDMQLQKKSIKRLSDRIVELERALQTSRMYLEDIKHMLDKSDVQGVSNVRGQSLHVAARQSPYPGTKIARFPVFDKYVPWEYLYDVYDPKTYTKSKDQFSEHEAEFADEDILELNTLREERMQLSEEEREEFPPLPQFKPVWNAVVAFRQENSTREVDRRSWITLDSQPVRYKLDATSLPQNPMGRTGIRGKGTLWRWGPNHVIKAVVTRWRRKYTPDFQPSSYLYVEGKKVLEFIAVRKEEAGELVFCLPGDALHGLTTPYSTLCEAFMKSVFDEQEVDSKTELDQTDMVQFFAQFASAQTFPTISQNFNLRNCASLMSPTHNSSVMQRLSSSVTSLDTQGGFCACLLYKGYVDDPRNTDNAWVEAEVWNFHYDFGDTFDTKISEEGSIKWKEVSPYIRLTGNEAVIVQEAGRIHDACN